MPVHQELPQRFRIRCKSGDYADLWLWIINVSQNGVPIGSPNWREIAKFPDRFKFHPKFEEEAAAQIILSREAADAYLRILNSIGLNVELVIG